MNGTISQVIPLMRTQLLDGALLVRNLSAKRIKLLKFPQETRPHELLLGDNAEAFSNRRTTILRVLLSKRKWEIVLALHKYLSLIKFTLVFVQRHWPEPRQWEEERNARTHLKRKTLHNAS